PPLLSLGCELRAEKQKSPHDIARRLGLQNAVANELTSLSESSAPARSMSARIDAHIRRTVAIAGVDTKPANQIGVYFLHRIHRRCDDLAIEARDAAVAVGVDDDVRGIAILMPAVTRRALNLGVVRWRPKARVHVQRG